MEKDDNLCFAEKLALKAKKVDKIRLILAGISLLSFLVAELAYFLPLFYPLLGGEVAYFITAVFVAISLTAILALVILPPDGL